MMGVALLENLGTADANDPNSCVSDAALYGYLRVDDGDDVIDTIGAVATEFLERATRTKIVPGRLQLTLDRFPHERTIRMPMPPLTAVESITYIDPSGEQQTLATSAYTVDATGRPGRVVLNPGYSWPETSAVANAVMITFRAGPATPPFMLQQAAKFLAAHWYENREAATDLKLEAMPLAVQSIIDMHSFPEVG